jgi:hypothetical protein
VRVSSFPHPIHPHLHRHRQSIPFLATAVWQQRWLLSGGVCALLVLLFRKEAPSRREPGARTEGERGGSEGKSELGFRQTKPKRIGAGGEAARWEGFWCGREFVWQILAFQLQK